MARVVKEHAVRRGEILDAAQRLVYAKGYEQMTIQDILDALQIAKGTFFHYFSSKQALLEALIERMLDEAEQVLIPIVNTPDLPALEKLQSFFTTAGRWKTDRKAFFLPLLRVWYADENAIVRQKLIKAGYERVTRLLTTVIRQGIQEGIFNTSYPDHVAEVVFSISEGLAETFAAWLLECESRREPLERIEAKVAAYNDSLVRVLGAPSGSLELIDAETLREWAISSRGNGKT